MSETPQLTPDEFVARLHALMEQVPTPPLLTGAERKTAHNASRMSDEELTATAGMVWASDKVAQAVAKPGEDVRSIVADTYRWHPAEVELRSALRSMVDANLVRRKRATIIARQAYGIGIQLARDPENAEIAAHVEHIKRLKAAKGRRKIARRPTPRDAAE